MNCIQFQDSISDYLEGALDPRARAECAAHRLVCGECRELHTDVRAAMQALSGGALEEIGDPVGLEERIIAATTTGEMLSCSEFDKLLERYFDGVIMASTFQNFQSHFEHCPKCRRLMSGIEEAIALCREVKEADVDVPESLHDRIVAATVGGESTGWFARIRSSLWDVAWMVATPQLAAAALIFAAGALFVLSRFGSMSNMAEDAEIKAERFVNQGQQKINSTTAIARTGFKRVNSLLFTGDAAKPAAVPERPRQIPPRPSPRPANDPGARPAR
ncbi:MAG: anti-sigma factor family protein [Blastocatellia bacterium]